jgi:hypothetical protein
MNVAAKGSGKAHVVGGLNEKGTIGSSGHPQPLKKERA